MSRGETDRRIEAALSLFIVSVWIALVADVVFAVGQARTFWLIRAGESGAAGAAWSWSWTIAPRHAAACGFAYGLWQIARSLVGGRLRTLVVSAFWVGVGTLILLLIWQPVVSWLVTATPYETVKSAMKMGSVTSYGLNIAGVSLLVAAIVGLARATPEGAKRRWAGRVAFTIVVAIVEMWAVAAVWAIFREQPLIAGAACVGLAVLRAVAYLTLLAPARRVYRVAIDRFEVPEEGPYRTPQRPAENWRSAPELRDAALGLLEVRRRVGQLAALSAISIVAIFVLGLFRVPAILAVDEAITGIIQVVFAALLVRGLAAYTRVPHEIPGRGLALAALACMMGGWVSSILVVVIGFFATVGNGWSSQWIFSTLPGDLLGCVVASAGGTLLLMGSLARASRGLGDEEVRRRAWMALGVSVGGFCVAVGTLVAGELLPQTPDWAAFGSILPFGGVLSLASGIVFVFWFRSLLAGAARMLDDGEIRPET